MAGEERDVALGRARDDLRGLALEEHLLRRHDGDVHELTLSWSAFTS